MNYDNISTFSWIIQLLIVVSKASFSLDAELNQLFEPIITNIQSFLNPLMPKSVNRAAWMFLSNFVDLSIKNLHKDQTENEEEEKQQTKVMTDLALIVKNSVLMMFEWSMSESEKNENEDDFEILLISIIGIVGHTLFLILNELKFYNEDENSLLFLQPDEIKMAASFLLHLFELQQSTGIRNFGATESVTCCVCLLVQFPGGAEQIAEIVDAEIMEQIIQSFSVIQNDDIKQLIRPGISTIMMLNSIEQE